MKILKKYRIYTYLFIVVLCATTLFSFFGKISSVGVDKTSTPTLKTNQNSDNEIDQQYLELHRGTFPNMGANGFRLSAEPILSNIKDKNYDSKFDIWEHRTLEGEGVGEITLAIINKDYAKMEEGLIQTKQISLTENNSIRDVKHLKNGGYMFIHSNTGNITLFDEGFKNETIVTSQKAKFDTNVFWSIEEVVGDLVIINTDKGASLFDLTTMMGRTTNNDFIFGDKQDTQQRKSITLDDGKVFIVFEENGNLAFRVFYPTSQDNGIPSLIVSGLIEGFEVQKKYNEFVNLKRLEKMKLILATKASIIVFEIVTTGDFINDETTVKVISQMNVLEHNNSHLVSDVEFWRQNIIVTLAMPDLVINKSYEVWWILDNEAKIKTMYKNEDPDNTHAINGLEVNSDDELVLGMTDGHYATTFLPQTPPSRKPQQPKKIDKIENVLGNKTDVKATWQPHLSHEEDMVKDYQLTWYKKGEEDKVIDTASVLFEKNKNTYTYIIENLEPKTNYTLSLLANNGTDIRDGKSLSVTEDFMTRPEKMNTPQNLIVKQRDNFASMKVTWTAIENENYKLKWQNTNDNSWKEKSIVKEDRGVLILREDDGVEFDETYKFQLFALDASKNMERPISDAAVFEYTMPKQKIQLEKPTNIKNKQKYQKIELSWDVGDDVDKYNLTWSKTGFDPDKAQKRDVLVENRQIIEYWIPADLEYGETYNFTLVAVSDNDNFISSQKVTYTVEFSFPVIGPKIMTIIGIMTTITIILLTLIILTVGSFTIF